MFSRKSSILYKLSCSTSVLGILEDASCIGKIERLLIPAFLGICFNLVVDLVLIALFEFKYSFENNIFFQTEDTVSVTELKFMRSQDYLFARCGKSLDSLDYIGNLPTESTGILSDRTAYGSGDATGKLHSCKPHIGSLPSRCRKRSPAPAGHFISRDIDLFEITFKLYNDTVITFVLNKSIGPVSEDDIGKEFFSHACEYSSEFLYIIDLNKA